MRKSWDKETSIILHLFAETNTTLLKSEASIKNSSNKRVFYSLKGTCNSCNRNKAKPLSKVEESKLPDKVKQMAVKSTLNAENILQFIFPQDQDSSSRNTIDIDDEVEKAIELLLDRGYEVFGPVE